MNLVEVKLTCTPRLLKGRTNIITSTPTNLGLIKTKDLAKSIKNEKRQ